MNKLTALRQQIDLIDGQLKKLLDARFELSRNVGLDKIESGKTVHDGARENFIIESILADKTLKYAEQVANVYRTLLVCSKDIQTELLNKMLNK